jgi:ADP-ribosylglycohydrolase/sugar/nucleoside kinase (ribokinase family)
MTLLVAGNAAILDLLLAAQSVPSSSEVGRLNLSPGTRGEWCPGGAAMTIALAARSQGISTRLWHPFPSEAAGASSLATLSRAGVDCSFVLRVDGYVPRCVMVDCKSQRLAWSSQISDAVPTDTTALLNGVTHVVVASAWGEWTEVLLNAAQALNVPCSLIGEAAVESLNYVWDVVILDDSQYKRVEGIRATTLVVTAGAEGATVFQGQRRHVVNARPARVVDTTGAGDAFGGTFLARLLLGDSAQDAGRTAADAAARVCEVWGAWTALTHVDSVASSPDQEQRIRGALIGTACGDAFGMPNSFLSAPPWRTQMEEGPANSPYHAGYPAGRITDDTEQALALTSALEDGFTLPSVAKRLNDWFVSVGGENSLAVGPSTKRALLAYQSGAAVDQIGVAGVTNGAAMRISPIGVYAALADLSDSELLEAVRIACSPTHATSPAISGAAALAAAIAAAIRGQTWEQVMDAAVRGARLGVSLGKWIYAPDIASRIQYARNLIAQAPSKAEVALLISDVVGAGEPTTESVPAAIAIADYVRGDPRQAIEISGNLRGDTDTVAAMAGAICGAYAGESAIPNEWRSLVARVNKLDVSDWSRRLHRVAASARGARRHADRS